MLLPLASSSSLGAGADGGGAAGAVGDGGAVAREAGVRGTSEACAAADAGAASGAAPGAGCTFSEAASVAGPSAPVPPQPGAASADIDAHRASDEPTKLRRCSSAMGAGGAALSVCVFGESWGHFLDIADIVRLFRSLGPTTPGNFL